MKFKGFILVTISALVLGIAGCSKEEAADVAPTGTPVSAPPLTKENGNTVTGNEPATPMPAPPGVATGTPGG